jgi:hypothetical protein
MQLLLIDPQTAEPIRRGQRSAAAQLTVRERARFFGHVHPEDLLAADERCWRWVGTRDHDQRPLMSLRGRPRGATRIACAALTGCAPDAGDFVVHTCETFDCVNPRHLRVVAAGVPAPVGLSPAAAAGRKWAPRETPLTDDEVRAVAAEARGGATVGELCRRWRLDVRALKRVLLLAERMTPGGVPHVCRLDQGLSQRLR